MPRLIVAFALLSVVPPSTASETLPGTRPLTTGDPLDEQMVAGIDRFVMRRIRQERDLRPGRWRLDFDSLESYQRSLATYRDRLRELIGAVGNRPDAAGLELIATTIQDAQVAQNTAMTITAVRWPVQDAITAEGLFLRPTDSPVARVVAIPDADWTPEMVSGLTESPSRFAADLASLGCEVLVPTLIDRDVRFSKNDAIGRKTNLPHREFVYRTGFEVGRHIIGYEVNKVLAAVDQLELRNRNDQRNLPIVVMGVGEGGLLALHSGALDTRIAATVVSGYFDQRERVWQEPIYRNVWDQLTLFGDAEIAGMIAPRHLLIESGSASPEVDGPPQTELRNIAAPGQIRRPDPASVAVELERASKRWQRLRDVAPSQIGAIERQVSTSAPLSLPVTRDVLRMLDVPMHSVDADAGTLSDSRTGFSAAHRQRRQLRELVADTQRVLRSCHRERERRFEAADRASADRWDQTSQVLREQVHQELFGQLPVPTMDPDPRSRLILQTDDFIGYEISLDVYPDVIAAGILLLPTGMNPGERRPVVVCQHGLEGTPMETIDGPGSKAYRAYKSFSAQLARRGFIVYAPQNPYRGGDAFRVLQRKSNPIGLSLFSYIIEQHRVALRWLATLPHVDSQRIGFYGLSYGGKTAMRVPMVLRPQAGQPGYCLSICSGDFNEWVAKNVSVDAPFSYLWTGEYEIYEWNMGHVANYAELGMLIAPRPFMVERGHSDGVAIDEWVAWEYAKVRRHYDQLGIGDRTEIEFFDGPHTIHGQRSFDFLQRHLDWRQVQAP
ncbi:hypothetical protein FYK55_16755 [Roseiconus nitratireducens]|uniref:Alpha/beta hydrolase family protein n=1 Tax=Roseiconus nitratireducens TaxID=2605748 RepID=A0A5M6D6I3_9BACT|nr:hypothetical protein [Roseiconus nitratireducens]KAA5541852.1 hypothetical protein FYK55_16755 [Roseiconus nitratireducens]